MAALNICRTIINLLTFSVLVVRPIDSTSNVVRPIDSTSNVDITCSEDDTCLKTYNLHNFPHTKYEGSENISGILHHGMSFASDGKCFIPKFVFRGISDLAWASWELEELDTPKPVKNLTTGEQMKEFFFKEGTPTFPEKISLCQSIAVSRELKYKPCGGVSECPEGTGTIEKDNIHCRRYYQGISIFPITTWLNKKADDGNYPSIQTENETHISIDWGKAKNFKCGEDIINVKTNNTVAPVSGSFTVSFKDPQKKIKELTISHDHFKFEKDYIEIKKCTALEEPKCYTFTVEIKMTLRFTALKNGALQYGHPLDTEILPKSTEKLSTKIQKSLSSNAPNGENDLADNSKIKTTNKTETYLFIQHKDNAADVNCLQKTVIVENMNNKEKHNVNITNDRKVNLTSFIVVPCEETKLKIIARNTANEDVIEKLYTFLPTVNADHTNTSNEDGTGHLIVNEAKFETCADLKFEVVCEALDMDTNITKILGYNIETEKSDEFKMEGSCKARAFLCKGTNETCSDKEVKSEWTYFYGQPSPKIGNDTAIGSVTGSIFGVLVIAAAVIMFMRFKEKKTREDDKERLLEKVKVKTESGPIPEHVVFKKDDNLGNYLIDITNLQAEVIEEFNALEKYDEENIKGKETTNTATTQLNLSRNRYKDMVPYDSKLVLLNRATGDPPSRYINASIIKFPTWDQKFLAVQAPKQNMFAGFWQLVMEHNVTVIAMITGLVEGGKVKAHQYWPDENDTKMMLDNGIEVELISVDKTRSVYHHRQFKVTNLSNVSITVDHLLCVLWEDMTAPKDTKVLRDLVEQADLLADDNPGTIIVHCSAGVGRTGTFIGYYKMTQDNDNDEVDRIDPFETVLEMRRARTKMVQKPLQYHYMMKCLSDYVTGETSVYS